MTHTGYSLKRPSLRSNYIKILNALNHINYADYEPTRLELSKISGVSHDQGFDKALNALIEAGAIGELNNNGRLVLKDDTLLNDAVDNDIKKYARN